MESIETIFWQIWISIGHCSDVETESRKKGLQVTFDKRPLILLFHIDVEGQRTMIVAKVKQGLRRITKIT